MVGIDLIIFSRGREKALLNTLQTMSKSPFRVLVFHNSQSRLRDDLIPNNSIYVHCPNMKYGERASIARHYILNEFCIISSDDDGIVSSALLEMENWLICNPIFKSVGGLSIGAFPYGSHVSASAAYSEMKGYSRNEEELDQRLENHLWSGLGDKPPRTGLYRLFRRDSMEKILEVFGDLSNISTPYIYEVAAEIVSTWAGPTNYIKELYWIRNWHTKEISKKDWNRQVSFHDWWNKSEYASEREVFMNVLVNRLGLDQTFIEELVTTYVIRWYEFFQSARKSKTMPFPRVARLIWQKIKVKVFPSKSPKRMENLLSNEFDFLDASKKEEVFRVVQCMFPGAKV